MPVTLWCRQPGGNVSTMLCRAPLGIHGATACPPAGGHTPWFGCLLCPGPAAWGRVPGMAPIIPAPACLEHGERDCDFGPKGISWPRGCTVPVLGVHQAADGQQLGKEWGYNGRGEAEVTETGTGEMMVKPLARAAGCAGHNRYPAELRAIKTWLVPAAKRRAGTHG